jgi:hypothetical protein
MYKKDNWVWLNLQNVHIKHPLKKLDWLHACYQVVDVPSPHTIQLNMPTGIHPVFHVNLVCLAATDPLLSQIIDNTQPPPLLVNREEEYKVKHILAVQRRKVGRGYHDKALVK